MNIIFYITCALLIATTFASRQCDATGDPHYRSFMDRGKMFHIYGVQGTYTLAKYVENNVAKLNVQSDMWYGRGFSNRALQLDMAVKIGAARIESNGGTKQKSIYNSISINGQKKRAPFGWTNADNNNDVRVKATKVNNNHMRMEIDSRKTNGLDLIVDIVYQGNGFVYHNIYVKVPNAWAPKTTGLCNLRAARNNQVLPVNMVTPSKVPQQMSLLHAHYNPANHVASRVGHIDWKNTALKIAAYKQCGEVNKLSGNNLHDCVYDVKIAGSIQAAQGYTTTNADIKELVALGKKKGGSGYLHAIYVLVVKMRKTVQDELKNAESVKSGLVKEINVLKGDLAATMKMFGLAAGLSTKNVALNNLINTMTATVRGQIAQQTTKLAEQEKVIADGKKEMEFIRKVLGFIGEQIEASRK